MKEKIQRNFRRILMKGLLVLMFGLVGEVSTGQVTYTLQTGNFTTNSLTVNTNGSYFAGSYNNGGTEVGFYANGSGGGYTGDPGVASFQTFTTNGIGSGTARPLKVGDQFSITCYVANSSSFFNSSSSGISFNGNTTYSTFANYSNNQRAKFQINQNGNWFPFANGAGTGYATPAQDVTFTIKLTSANTANLTLNTSNGATSYDMLLGNSPASSGDNITSFAIWNQTSGTGNDMYWKNGSLTATGSVELGNGNGTSTISGVISDGLAANSTSTASINTVTKAGSGTITLTGANTYTGMTTVSAGTLKLNRTGGTTIPVTNNVTINGGTLQVSSNQTLNNLTISSGGLTIDDGVTLTINGTLTYSGGTLNYGSTTTGNLIVSNSGKLIVSSGTFTTSGRVTLKSDASGTASIGNSAGSISGNVTVERFVTSSGRRYRFLSSPVQSNTVANWMSQFYVTGPCTSAPAGGLGTTNDQGWHVSQANIDYPGAYNSSTNPRGVRYTSIRTYDETVAGSLDLGFTDVTTSTALTAGKGFKAYIRGPIGTIGQLDGSVTSQSAFTLSLSGSVNQGEINANPTRSGSSSTDDGWNLLGNPYPCAYDFNAQYDAANASHINNINPTVYVYSAVTGGYVSYNASSNSNGGLSNGIIPSGAGFFIQANASSPVFKFEETYKTLTAPTSLHKTEISTDEFGIKYFKDSTESDYMTIKMFEGSTLNSEMFDIKKYRNENLNLAAYGEDSIDLTGSCIPRVNGETRIKLNVEATLIGTYQFDFKNMENFDAGVSVHLFDRFTNKTTDVKANTLYIFEMGAGVNQWGKNRFELILNGKASTGVKENEINNTITSIKLSIYPNPATDILNINLSNANFKNSNIVIYNISGTEVSNITMNGANAKINIDNLSNGVYFVKVSNENGFNKTVKFVK